VRPACMKYEGPPALIDDVLNLKEHPPGLDEKPFSLKLAPVNPGYDAVNVIDPPANPVDA
jgi:hypothetical protein